MSERIGITMHEVAAYIFELLPDDIDRSLNEFIKKNKHYELAVQDYILLRNQARWDHDTMLRVLSRVDFDQIAKLYLPKPAVIYHEHVKTVKKKKKKKRKLQVK